MVVRAELRTGQTLQQDAESPGGDVEVTGLDPDPIGIRNPVRAVVEVDVGNEVFAAPSIRIQAIGELLKAVIGKGIPLCEPKFEKPEFN